MLFGELFFVFKQKTAYELRISDWSSDVCSSDLTSSSGRAERRRGAGDRGRPRYPAGAASAASFSTAASPCEESVLRALGRRRRLDCGVGDAPQVQAGVCPVGPPAFAARGQFLRGWHEIGRAHVCTPVTNAHLVCRLLLAKTNKH